jgi:S1-C subfamily serine protease
MTGIEVLTALLFVQGPIPTAQVVKRLAPSVVAIEGQTDRGEVVGSGFFISKDGQIATNLYVIRDFRNARGIRSISVLAVDERRDLAVIKVAA